MSARPPSEETPAPTHVIWPETAVPFFLNAGPEIVGAIAAVAPARGAVINGAPRIEWGGAGDVRIRNSVLAIHSRGEVVATSSGRTAVKEGVERGGSSSGVQ